MRLLGQLLRLVNLHIDIVCCNVFKSSIPFTRYQCKPVYPFFNSREFTFEIMIPVYLSLGMWGSSLSAESNHRMWGGGLPWAEQLNMAPVLLEKSSLGGGSCRNTGPCKCEALVPRRGKKALLVSKRKI